MNRYKETNSTKKTNLSTQVIINVNGDNIDNLIGHVYFNNTIFQLENELYKSNSFNLISEDINGVKSIKIVSDLLDANIYGKFKIIDLPNSILKLLNNFLPSYFASSTSGSKYISPQNFEYNLLFKNSDAITRLFAPQITIAPKTFIKGKFNSISNEFNLIGNSTKLTFNNFIVKDWNMDATTNKGIIINTSCEKLYVTDSAFLGNFKLGTKGYSDSMNLIVSWDNETKRQNKGELKVLVKFLQQHIIFIYGFWNHIKV